MSVDYDAKKGIGYQVCEGEEIADTEELEDGLFEYLYNEVGDEFDCLDIGDSYTGCGHAVFLVLKEPFKNGLNLEGEKLKLDKEVKRLKVKSEGEFGLVGGLRVW